MSNVLRIAKEGKVEAVSREVAAALGTWDLRAMLLQALIPLGLEAACALVEEEVHALAGPRYARDGGDRARWGRQRGFIYLADQKLALRVPACGTRRQTPRCRCRRTPGSSSPARLTRRSCAGSSPG